MALDLNSLLQQLTANTQQQQNVLAQQAGAANTVNQQEAGQFDALAARGAAVAENAAALARKQAEVDYRLGAALQTSSAVLGMNPDDVNNKLVENMAAYNAAEDQRKVTRQKFDKLSNVSLLDNPLQYIVAQLMLPQVANENNALVAQRDAAAGDIAKRQQLLAAQKSSIVVNTAEAVKDINLAKAENDLSAAQLQLDTAKFENKSKLAQRALQQYSLQLDALKVGRQNITDVLQIAQFEMGMQERAEARQARAEEAAARRAVKDAEAVGYAQLNSNLSAVSAMLGRRSPMTVETLKLIPNKDVREAWVRAADTGSLGGTLLESLTFVLDNADQSALQMTNPGMATAVRKFTEGLAAEKSRIAMTPEARMGKLKEKDITLKAAEDYQDRLIAATGRPGSTIHMWSREFDSAFTPYRAQHKVMIDEATSGAGAVPATNAMLQALKQQVTVQNQADPNLSVSDEQRAFNVIAAQVAKGQITKEQAAADIALYYRAAAAKNMDMYGYTAFNLPMQTSYRVQSSSGGMFPSIVSVDLMKPSEVERALAAQSVQYKIDSQWGGTPFGFR